MCSLWTPRSAKAAACDTVGAGGATAAQSRRGAKLSSCGAAACCSVACVGQAKAGRRVASPALTRHSTLASPVLQVRQAAMSRGRVPPPEIPIEGVRFYLRSKLLGNMPSAEALPRSYWREAEERRALPAAR